MPDNSSVFNTSNTSNTATHECQNIKLLTEMQIKMAEMSRDMVHFAACFQELNAQLSEFMQKQDEKISQITATCTTRSVRWGEINSDITELKNCQRDLYKRIEAIEKTHSQAEGVVSALKPYKDYIIYVIMTGTAILLTYLFARGGLVT